MKFVKTALVTPLWLPTSARHQRAKEGVPLLINRSPRKKSRNLAAKAPSKEQDNRVANDCIALAAGRTAAINLVAKVVAEFFQRYRAELPFACLQFVLQLVKQPRFFRSDPEFSYFHRCFHACYLMRGKLSAGEASRKRFPGWLQQQYKRAGYCAALSRLEANGSMPLRFEERMVIAVDPLAIITRAPDADLVSNQRTSKCQRCLSSFSFPKGCCIWRL